MKRRNAPLLAALLVAGFSSYATSGADAAKPVFKVDSVEATTEAGAPHKLIIKAKGAVRTGGWDTPKLRVTTPKPGEMIIVFVAVPPPAKTMVVQAMLPVQATLTVPMPKGDVTTVKVSSETNSVTTKILR